MAGGEERGQTRRDLGLLNSPARPPASSGERIRHPAPYWAPAGPLFARVLSGPVCLCNLYWARVEQLPRAVPVLCLALSGGRLVRLCFLISFGVCGGMSVRGVSVEGCLSGLFLLF